MGVLNMLYYCKRYNNTQRVVSFSLFYKLHFCIYYMVSLDGLIGHPEAFLRIKNAIGVYNTKTWEF